ncbi:MAG TPA: polyphosphate polymerase domain-containing protein [Bacteroidales bacterium]|nr:polyphosphate polymerase domain-containing protein [Bacteroidales bacterium]
MPLDHQLIETTHQFPSFTLNEDLFLFDRRDFKYLFLPGDLIPILERLKEHYYILTIEGKTFSDYRTTYFDTEDYDLYKTHHNGKRNRYKVRLRNYRDSELAYLEVKFKSNKQRTLKKRVLKGNTQYFTPEDYQFLKSAIPYEPNNLLPSLMTRYVRLTLVNFNYSEKVTIDFDLHFRHLKNGKETRMPEIGIIEVKNEGDRHRPLLSKLLNNGLARKKRISKYCLGMSLLDPDVKKNLYKPKLLFIDQMKKQQHDASHSAGH